MYEALALLKVLLECGNKTVQAGLTSLISAREHRLFPTLQRMLKQSAVVYRERYICMHSNSIFFEQPVLARTWLSSAILYI